MQTLFDQFSQILGITLLHSLWQGLIVYVLLWLLFLCFRSGSAKSRYNMGLLALAASVLWPVITLFIEIGKHPIVTQALDTDAEPLAYLPMMVHTYAIEPTNTLSFGIERYMPYLVILWFIGIILSSARLLFGWRNIYRIKQTVISSPVLESSIQKLSQMLNIAKKVSVCVSEHIDVPCIIGYLKPMIILPAAIITQFTPGQIQSVLVHEMAHIRRNDYFINVLQQVVGILFFFNPFTHLINRIIYAEREHCCDDLVLTVTGEPLVYAQTLLQLEEYRRNDRQLALAATGKKYHLLNRIKRIMETKKQVSNIRHIMAGILMLIGAMGTIAWLNPEIKDGKVSISPSKQIPFMLPDEDTIKAKAKSKKPAPKHTAAAISPKGTKLKPKSNAVSPKGNYYVMGYSNATLNKLSAEVDMRSIALDRYYNTPEYHAIEKELEAKGRLIDSFYNKPELKKLQAELDAKSQAFDKLNDTPEMKELQKKMDDLSKAQSAYFESAEYKKLQRNFDEQGKWFEKADASASPAYKAKSEAFKKAGEQLRAYTSNAGQEQIRAYSKQIRDFYNSDEYKKQRDAIREAGDNIRKAYQAPAIKQQQQQLNALSKQMRDYNNKPEIMHLREEMNKAMAAMRAYQNSPAFKLLREQMEKNNKAMYQQDSFTADTTHKTGK